MMRPSRRDELVQKAQSIFYDNGFHATGMDQISAETGISKTSIYNYFRSKDELILAVLRLRDEQFRNWLYRRMEALGSSPRGEILAMFDVLEDWFGRKEFKSCIFIKASSEYQDPDHPIHSLSADHKLMLERHISQLAKKAGIRNPELIARQILLLKEGAIVSAHLGHTSNPANDAKRAAIVLLDACTEA